MSAPSSPGELWHRSIGSSRLARSSHCRCRSIRAVLNTPRSASPRRWSAQKRFDLDGVRDHVRAGVVEAWGLMTATKGQIAAAQAQTKAARDALNGVLQEARAGQRTTLDVLNAQQELVNAQVMLAGTQRDRVVTSYTLLAAVGRLEPEVLRLPVALADAK